MIFKYWLNKPEWHSKLIFECEAESILEADKKYEEKTGNNPVKQPFVGCSISKESMQKVTQPS